MSEVVAEADLKAEFFLCCGQGGLDPIGCPQCGRPMVYCHECEALFGDLNNLTGGFGSVNCGDPTRPRFSCSSCGFDFPYRYWEREYPITREQWVAAGYGNLLRER